MRSLCVGAQLFVLNDFKNWGLRNAIGTGNRCVIHCLKKKSGKLPLFRCSNQGHAQFPTFPAHVFRPNRSLYFTDVSLMEQNHAQPALPYTATDR